MKLEPRPNLILPPSVYRGNAADIASYVRQLGLDCALVCGHSINDLGTWMYGEGMERLTCAIVMANGDVHWVVPAMEVDHLAFRQAPCAPAENVTGYEDKIHIDPETSMVVDNGLNTLLDRLHDLGCQNALVEPHMPALWVNFLNRRGLDVTIDEKPFVQLLKVDRGLHPIEQALMEASFRLAKSGMDKMLQAVAAGYYTVGALFGLKADVLSEMMQAHGFEITKCTLLMGAWPGPESHMSHYIPHLGDQLRPGYSNIAFIFPELYRFYSEIEEMILIGQPLPRLREIYQVMLEAINHTMNKGMFRAGVDVNDLDEMIRDYIAQRLGHEGMHHRVGHLLGPGAHHFAGNHGGIVRGSSMKLMPNCWYSFEPGFTDPEVGAVRRSVPFRITADGMVVWLWDPVLAIDELIIPEVTPVSDPKIDFLIQLPEIEKVFRQEVRKLAA